MIIYFIKSFFNYYEKGIYYKRINDDLFSYFTSGNPNVFNLSNTNTNSKIRNKLKNLFKSNSNRLLQGDNALSGRALKQKKPPGLSVITENTPRSNSNTNLGNSNTNLGLSAKTSRSNINLSASFLSLQSTPPPRPTQNLFENQNLNLSNQYSKESFNKKKNFRNISSAGKQSNMMVSSDNNFYFKKYSSRQPAQTKKKS